MPFNVAIDGPAGAGKSTVAKAVAARNQFIYVDTGAMYRAMGLYFMRQGIRPEDEAAIAAACGDVEIHIAYEDGVQQVYLNGENVSTLIRTEEVGNMTSVVSVHMPVREKLVELQQQIARRENVVMDGRDIGTCVLPDAGVKVYLTASAHVRALRRYKEQVEKGDLSKTLEEIEAIITERDERDMHREHAPLTQAPDAVLIDSSDMTLEDVVQAIEALMEAAWKK